MAYRKRVIRKAPVRRRRRTMGAAMSAASIKSAVNTTLMGAAGGAAAAVLTNVIGDNLGGFKSYTGLVGALATSVFFKQPVIAAGMAGYAGSKVAAELTGSSLLAEGGMYLPSGSSMYLQGYDTPMMGGENIYASSYTLSGYEVPGL
jgi:H+/gluconate symporter-like permease